jgi:hypothetical protein
MKGTRYTAGLLLCIAVISGCSSGSATRETETERAIAPAKGPETAVLIDDRGLILQSFGSDSSNTVQPDIAYGGQRWPAPDQAQVALTVSKGESTYLALVGSDGSYRDVHQSSGDVTYSVVWSPTSDSLLIGFNGQDQRGVDVYSLTAERLTSVGCSASGVALSWGREDWFVVGNHENQYVVERAGCATIESIDARKMHEVTFDTRGDRVSYILRELEYDPQTRQYAPDSSLYVATSVGTDPILVAGNRYRPHRPTWSPNAASLAYDVQLLEHPDRRLISIWDLETGSSAFLNPKAVDSKSSEWAPKWSPSGGSIAYLHSSKGKPAVVSVRNLSDSFSKNVGKDGERLFGWLDDGRLILKSDLGTRIVTTDGKESLLLSPEASVISVGGRL